MRLRHILVRHCEVTQPSKNPAGKARSATRLRQEAESMLRGAVRALQRDLAESKKSPKNANELVSIQTAKFAELCKDLSECATAQNGGAMRGDLGWVSPERMKEMGGNFWENMEHLRPGQ